MGKTEPEIGDSACDGRQGNTSIVTHNILALYCNTDWDKIPTPAI